MSTRIHTHTPHTTHHTPHTTHHTPHTTHHTPHTTHHTPHTTHHTPHTTHHTPHTTHHTPHTTPHTPHTAPPTTHPTHDPQQARDYARAERRQGVAQAAPLQVPRLAHRACPLACSPTLEASDDGMW